MPSHSLVWSVSSALLAALAAPAAATTGTKYTLSEDYSGDKFLNGFTFFDDLDPTHGYVKLVFSSPAKYALDPRKKTLTCQQISIPG